MTGGKRETGCSTDRQTGGRVRLLFLRWVIICAAVVLLQPMAGCAADKGEYRWLSDVLVEEVDGNIPSFSDKEITETGFEKYSALDRYGRCGEAFACVGPETMPNEERGKIGQIRPSGWHTVKYPGIDGNYLYNRCHLIAFQLTGENANEKNLITGTRFLNNTGMLPYEEKVGDYVRETGNHVMYRVTPRFEGKELVARGVEMEAYSVEDGGKGVSFHVFVYNVQPGILINYMTGESMKDPQNREISEGKSGRTVRSDDGSKEEKTAESRSYIVNRNTKKFHLPSCPSVSKMKEKNRVKYEGTRQELIEGGLSPCEICNP